ncbi:MAG: DinB family protein [bacterium]|nr:DinB family protein [bacterium]
MLKPEPSEYNPYFKAYIDLVPEGQFQVLLSQNSERMIAYCNAISETDSNYQYGADKWSIKEVLMHIIDVERTMVNRAFVASRGDNESTLFKMDDALYQKNAKAATRSFKNLVEEFNLVRANTFFFFNTLNDSQSELKANTVPQAISVRALAYIIIGHSYHHLNILKERYKF